MTSHPVDPDVRRKARVRELQQLEREAVRAERRLLIQTLGGSVACSLAGSALMLWSFHSTDGDLAPVAFWGGLAGGYSGISILLLRHALRVSSGEI